jgi:hypothetical protein
VVDHLARSGKALENRVFEAVIDIASKGMSLIIDEKDLDYADIRFNLISNHIEGFIGVGDSYSLNTAENILSNLITRHQNNLILRILLMKVYAQSQEIKKIKGELQMAKDIYAHIEMDFENEAYRTEIMKSLNQFAEMVGSPPN